MHPPDQADPVGRRQRPGPRPHGDRVREGGSVLRARRRRRRPDGRDGDVHVGARWRDGRGGARRGAGEERGRGGGGGEAPSARWPAPARRRPDAQGPGQEPHLGLPPAGSTPGAGRILRLDTAPRVAPTHPFLPAPEECEQWTGAAQRVVRARLPLPAHPRAGQNTREGQSAVGSMCRETSQCRSSARSI